MQNRINKINRTYKKKCKFNTINKYHKTINRLFLTVNILNKIIPNFYQGKIAKMLDKDIKKVDYFKH